MVVVVTRLVKEYVEMADAWNKESACMQQVVPDGVGEEVRWNRRRWLSSAAGLSALSLCCGCRSTPFTGRPQLRFIPKSMEMSLGEQSYAEVLA